MDQKSIFSPFVCVWAVFSYFFPTGVGVGDVSGLDLSSRMEVWARIKREASERATLVCTQSVEEAEALG